MRTHTHAASSCYSKGISLGLLRAGHTHLQTPSHCEKCGRFLMSKQTDKLLQKGKVVKLKKEARHVPGLRKKGMARSSRQFTQNNKHRREVVVRCERLKQEAQTPCLVYLSLFAGILPSGLITCQICNSECYFLFPLQIKLSNVFRNCVSGKAQGWWI